MAWIQDLDESEARGELASLYARIADPETGRVDNILKVHSLDTRGLKAHMALYRSAMRASPGLPLAEREMIALVVSLANGCHY